jgi:hypothetical protein
MHLFIIGVRSGRYADLQKRSRTTRSVYLGRGHTVSSMDPGGTPELRPIPNTTPVHRPPHPHLRSSVSWLSTGSCHALGLATVPSSLTITHVPTKHTAIKCVDRFCTIIQFAKRQFAKRQNEMPRVGYRLPIDCHTQLGQTGSVVVAFSSLLFSCAVCIMLVCCLLLAVPLGLEMCQAVSR